MGWEKFGREVCQGQLQTSLGKFDLQIILIFFFFASVST